MEKPNQPITAFLLPREKYAEASRRYEPAPVTRTIEKGDKKLFYFGANHSHNPADPQYSALRNYWQTFLRATQGRARLVLIEGGTRPLSKNEDAAIKDGSEGGLMTLLANESGVLAVSPDISLKECAKRLPEISKEEFLLLRFSHFADSLRRQGGAKPDFERAIQKWCASQDVFISEIKKLYKNIVGRELAESDNFNDLVNPNKTETRINEIARLMSDLRDANIVSEIERYWKEGKNLFVVFGRGHLIIQEPALQKVLK